MFNTKNKKKISIKTFKHQSSKNLIKFSIIEQISMVWERLQSALLLFFTLGLSSCPEVSSESTSSLSYQGTSSQESLSNKPKKISFHTSISTAEESKEFTLHWSLCSSLSWLSVSGSYWEDRCKLSLKRWQHQQYLQQILRFWQLNMITLTLKPQPTLCFICGHWESNNSFTFSGLFFFTSFSTSSPKRLFTSSRPTLPYLSFSASFVSTKILSSHFTSLSVVSGKCLLEELSLTWTWKYRTKWLITYFRWWVWWPFWPQFGSWTNSVFSQVFGHWFPLWEQPASFRQETTHSSTNTFYQASLLCLLVK